MQVVDDEEPLALAATLASPYSGSTLFAILLAHHSHLSSDGETFPLGPNKFVCCSCGQAQIDCPYYRQAATHLLGPDGRNWDPALFAPSPWYSRFPFVDKALGRQWSNDGLRLAQECLRAMIPAWRRKDQAFLAAHVRFMENSLRLRGARVYVDGTKSVRRASLFARSARIRLKVIHLIRDGRGFCFSYLKNEELPRSQLAVAARAWLKNIDAVDRFHARWPHIPVLEVRYEDLCRDLPEILRRVCQFLDVPYEPVPEGASARTCHVLGNRMRLNFSGQVEECLSWQREFTPKEIDFLNRAMWTSLERYHYSL
jgi:hypothetical protein